MAPDIRSTSLLTTGNFTGIQNKTIFAMGNFVYIRAFCRIGVGDPSDILNTRTKGSKPIIPEAARFIEVSTNSITLHLSAWSDGGCPMLYFVVEHKKK